MDKRGKSFLIVGGIFVFLVLVFSVFVFADLFASNSISYSNNDLVVDFSDSEDKYLGSIELKSHEDVDEVKHIDVSIKSKTIEQNVVMWYDFDFKEIYTNGLGEVKIINMKTGKIEDKSYNFVYAVYEDIIIPANKTIPEYTITQIKEWIDFNEKDIPKGNTTIGLIVDTSIGDWYDAIWTIAGKEVSRHAEWEVQGVFDLVGICASNVKGLYYNNSNWFINCATDKKIVVLDENFNVVRQFTGLRPTDTMGVGGNLTSLWFLEQTAEHVYEIDINTGASLFNFTVSSTCGDGTNGITYLNGILYLGELGTARICSYYPNGTFITKFPTVGSNAAPSSPGENGTDLFVTDIFAGIVFMYKPDGTSLGNSSALSGMTRTSGFATNLSTTPIGILSTNLVIDEDEGIRMYEGAVAVSSDTTPPNVTTPTITPVYPTSSNDLNCYATLTDETQTNLTANWKWYKNGALELSGSKSVTNETYTLIATLDSGNLTKGQEWICEVTPYDGYNNGNGINSSSVTILNSPPIHDNPILLTSDNKNLSTQDLTCSPQNSYDGDGDDIVNIYNWYKNGTTLISLNMPYETNADDYSGEGNDGSVSEATPISNGKIGGAYSFDGGNSITILDDSSLDFSDEKTWEIWFKRDGTGAEEIFNKGNSTDTNYKLEFLSDDMLKFSYSLAEGIAYDIWGVESESDFNEGAYTSTYYNTTEGAVMLSDFSGDYESKVFDDSGKELSFDSLSWDSEIPLVELIPEEDMVLLMHMNEASGVIVDFSGNDNNGTNNGADYGVEGKINTGLGFDGDYVLGSSNDFNVGEGTLELWAKSEWLTGTGAGIVFSWDSSESGDWGQIRLAVDYDSNSFYFTVDEDDNNNNDGQYTYSEFADGEWVHFLGTWKNVNSGSSDGEVRFYVNGDEKTPTTGVKIDATTINTDVSNVYVGVHKTSGFGSYFSGSIDELAVWNRSLTANEVLEIYEKGVDEIINLSLSVRSCDDDACSGEGWEEVGESPVDITSLDSNIYFQFKASFETDDVDFSPKLFNVAMNYSKQITEQEASITSTTQITDDGEWHLATITYDDSGEDNLKFYINDSLDNQKTETNSPIVNNHDLTIGNGFTGDLDEFRIYDSALSLEQIQAHYNLEYNKIVSEETSGGDVYSCEVTPNDGEEDGVMKSSGDLEVYWGILFDVTSGETGKPLPNFNIYCDNSFSASEVSSPYETGFESGSYSCIFSKDLFFNKTKIFVANTDKTVDVVMSLIGGLTYEEHTWLEWLYTCWNGGDCWDLLTNINDTTTQIWQRLTGTDTSVITQEDVLSYELNASSNIVINYTIEVPYKPEVAVNELLPIRLYFWFTNPERTQCYSQDKGTDTNRAETPYCLPLVAKILGPNDGTISFQVSLKPNLPNGIYNFTRSIEIDPLGVWTQYGREDIGQVEISENGDASMDVSGEERTNKPISLSSGDSSSGSSRNGGTRTIIKETEIITLVPQEDVKTEDEEQEEIEDSEVSGRSWLTGGVIGTNLLSGWKFVVILGIFAGLFAVIIISRTVLKIKSKK